MSNPSSLVTIKVTLISRIVLIMQLAYRDLLFDRKIALCIVFSLVSVIAPLLLLFGLKYGIITQLNQQLLSDPRNLEIVVLGNKNHTKTWIYEFQKNEGVGFIIPLTRSLNTQADFLNGRRHFNENVELIPTNKGDPLLKHQSRSLNLNELIVSKKIAEDLNLQKGDNIKMIISRRKNDQFEKWQPQMRVVDILETDYFDRKAVFLSLETLILIESYKDGQNDFLIDEFALDNQNNPELQELIASKPSFAKFRLFAATLDDVSHLANLLSQENIETRTRQREIDNVTAISYVLNVIFSIIAWITFIGCIASLSGAFLANIDRKRKDLAVMRLLGFNKKEIGAYILCQSFIMTTIAFILACLLYRLGSMLFNSTLGAFIPEVGFVTYLTYLHLLSAFGLALLLSSSVALIGVFRASRILPSESLREL